MAAVASKFTPLLDVNYKGKKKKQKKKNNVSVDERTPVGALKINKTNPPRNKKNGSSQTVAPQVEDEAQREVDEKQQWEEWKIRDEEFVLDAFQTDLKKAMMLSKLDQENGRMATSYLQSCSKVSPAEGRNGVRKDVLPPNGADGEALSETRGTENVSQGRVKSKKEKAGVKNAKGKNEAAVKVAKSIKPKKEEEDEREAPSAKKETKKRRSESNTAEIVTLVKTKDAADLKRTQIRPENVESVLVSQYKYELEKKEAENAEYRQRERELNEENDCLKRMNSKFCMVLANGHLREKARMLMQIETLTNDNELLTKEIKELHTLLEQERSKSGILQLELDKHKYKIKDHK